MPFGHAAYFGVGAYVCAIFMKDLGVPFLLAWLLGGVGGALFAAVFGFFCVRLTSVYFSMLTMAFAQIVWAICFKWNDVTGGEQGYPNVPMPSMAWLEWIPWVGGPQDRPQVLLPDADPGGLVDRRHAPHRAFAVRPHAHQPSATTPSARSSSASTCASTS